MDNFEQRKHVFEICKQMHAKEYLIAIGYSGFTLPPATRWHHNLAEIALMIGNFDFETYYFSRRATAWRTDKDNAWSYMFVCFCGQGGVNPVICYDGNLAKQVTPAYYLPVQQGKWVYRDAAAVEWCRTYLYPERIERGYFSEEEGASSEFLGSLPLPKNDGSLPDAE